MKKYGEIERFKIEDLLYILKVEKWDDHPFPELNIPYFDIYISKKSSKQHRTEAKNFRYSLLNEGFQNFKTIKKIEKSFSDYLSLYEPEYIAVSAFEDTLNIFHKRIEFYSKRLAAMGYIEDSIDNTYEQPVYFFKLK